MSLVIHVKPRHLQCHLTCYSALLETALAHRVGLFGRILIVILVFHLNHMQHRSKVPTGFDGDLVCVFWVKLDEGTTSVVMRDGDAGLADKALLVLLRRPLFEDSHAVFQCITNPRLK